MFVFPVGPLFRLRVSHHLDHAPFPHPAHQIGRADFPHAAFGQGVLAMVSQRKFRAQGNSVSVHHSCPKIRTDTGFPPLAEPADQGHDVESELVIGQGEVGLGLGAVAGPPRHFS